MFINIRTILSKMQDHNLTTGNIQNLVRKIAIPASIGFFFHTMYNVVDTYFAGLIATTALAALSVSFPVFFIIIALSSGVGTGATALIAHALGGKDNLKAKHYAAQAATFSVLVGIGVTIVGLLISPFLFRLLGAEGEYLQIALDYMNIIFYGSVFFILIQIGNAILNAAGDTKTLRNYMIAGFFLNVILDPWFLYGGFGIPAMGVKGIALATVVVQIIGTMYVGYKVVKVGFISREFWHHLVPHRKVVTELIRQGLPASLNMMTIAIGIFVITYFVNFFGTQAVAAYGIATRIEQIALLPSIGLNIATLALVGQNMGAKKYSRIKETLKTVLWDGFLLILVGYGLVFAFARQLMGFFTQDAAVIAVGVEYLRIATFISFAYVITFTHISALQGMKKPSFALWIGIYRQIVGPLAVFYLVTRVFGLGLPGIWWGIFAVTWSAALVTFWYTRRVVRTIGD